MLIYDTQNGFRTLYRFSRVVCDLILHFDLNFNFYDVNIISVNTRTFWVYGFSKILQQIAVLVINNLTKCKIYAIINNDYASITFVPLSKETAFRLFRFQKRGQNMLFLIRFLRIFLKKYYDIQKIQSSFFLFFSLLFLLITYTTFSAKKF